MVKISNLVKSAENTVISANNGILETVPIGAKVTLQESQKYADPSTTQSTNTTSNTSATGTTAATYPIDPMFNTISVDKTATFKQDINVGSTLSTNNLIFSPYLNQSIATNSTISTISTLNIISPPNNLTDMILQPGAFPGQLFMLLNNTNYDVGFKPSTESNVNWPGMPNIPSSSACIFIFGGDLWYLANSSIVPIGGGGPGGNNGL